MSDLKKFLSAVLAVLLAIVPMMSVGATENSQLSASYLHYLQEQLPDGKYWNHDAEQSNDPYGWTEKPCTHHTDGNCIAYDGLCGCNMFDNAIQCHGFASLLAYSFFGTSIHTWQQSKSLDGLKAGDVLRVNNDRHTIFVTAVQGDRVTYADCNVGHSCKIRWNAETTKDRLAQTLAYVCKAPETTKVPSTPQTGSEAEYKLGERVRIAWEAQPDADFFTVEIYLNGEYRRTQTVTEQTEYSFTPTEYGKYEFLIRAVNAVGASEAALFRATVDPHTCQITYFSDVPDFMDWSHEGIEYVVLNGMFKGTSETSFSPEATMTRSMIATALWRRDGMPTSNVSMPYTDVAPQHWCAEAVRWAYESGVMDGVGLGRFEPDALLTREQIVTVLYRYAELHKLPCNGAAELESFADSDAVADWSREAMQWAVGQEILRGTEENESVFLHPSSGATRAQVATLLTRFVRDFTVK